MNINKLFSIKKIKVLSLILLSITSSKIYSFNYNQNGIQLFNQIGKTISTDSFLTNYPNLNINQKNFDKEFNNQLNNRNYNQVAALIDYADKKQLRFIKNQETINLYKNYLMQKKQIVKNIDDLEKIINIEEKKTNNGLGILKLPKKPLFKEDVFTSKVLQKDIMKRKIYLNWINGLEKDGFLKTKDLKKIQEIKNILSIKNKDNFLLDEEDEFISNEIYYFLKNKKEERKKIIQENVNNAVKKKLIESHCVNFDILNNYIRSEYGFNQYKNLFPEKQFGEFSISKLNKNQNQNDFIITPSFDKIYHNLLKYENKKAINKEELYKNLLIIKINNHDLLEKIFLLSSLLNENDKLTKNNSKTLLEKHIEELSILSSSLNEEEFQNFLKTSLTLINYNALICIY